MNAWVLHGRRDLRREIRRQPSAEPGFVVVRVRRAGICGTDLHYYHEGRNGSFVVQMPFVMGHEFAGEIVALGQGVRDLALGDLVSGEGHLVCGRCRNCMAGRRVQCARTDSVGVSHPGAFAEYISLPATNVWRHRPGIELDVAAIFDPFGNAVHTALTFPVLGEDVLVTGAGPIGIMAAAVARHAGARHVVITDVSAYRLELARKLGVTLALHTEQDSMAAAMDELRIVEGFDVGFEMSGQASALLGMLEVMCHGGRIAMLGLPTENFGIDWAHLVTNMLTIKGIYGRQMFETWYWMSVFVEAGLDISPVITHRFPAERFEEAFAVLESGQCGKVVLSWDDAAR